MGIFSFLTGSKTLQWASLRVTKKEQLSEDFVVLTLEKNGKDSFETNFTPGQYVTLEIEQKGVQIRRSYSICGKSENGFKIGVKRIEGGQMSPFLHDQTIKGSTVKVHIPEGGFVLNGEQNICAFVAGSGITPVASMIEAYNLGKSFRVFFGVKRVSDIVFKPLLDSVKSTVYLSQEHQDGYKSGRLTYDALMEELKADLTLLQSDVYLLCGPVEFMQEIERGLLFFGVPETKIKREYFTPPKKEATKENTNKINGPVAITATLDGQTHEFTFQAGKKTLLEGLEEQRLDPPYSCRGGVCSSCRAKVTSGKVSLRQNYTLTDKEVADGYILTCQSDPCSETVSITFDE